MKYPLGIDFLQNEEKLKEHLKMAISFFPLEDFPKKLNEIRLMKKSKINEAWKKIELSYVDNCFMIAASSMNIEKYKEFVTEIFLPKLQELRVKVAWAEILAFLHPDICIPKILKLSICYIKDDFVIEWSRKNEDNFKNFTKTIKPKQFDGRTMNKNIHNEYTLWFKYNQLVHFIKECRKENSMNFFLSYFLLKKMNKKQEKALQINCFSDEFYKFCKEYEDRVLGKENIGELTIEMMESEKLIQSIEYFRKLKTKVKNKFKGYSGKVIAFLPQYLSNKENDFPLYPIKILEDFSILI